MAFLEGVLGETRASLDAETRRAATIEQSVAERARERDGVFAELEVARRHGLALDGLYTALQASHESTLARLAAVELDLSKERERARAAASKWDADRASLDRAKDALAVVLAQIEATEAQASHDGE